MEGKFKFWVPLEISKAKDKDGKTKMRLSGIASTNDEDSDGEFLDPSGFDISTFKNGGLVNWHHQLNKNPEALIGLVKDAKITKAGLHIDTELFDDSEMAQKVYKLAEMMEKAGKPLGFSIEGKALQRCAINPKIVKAAKIHAVAITPLAKNPNTFANIIKGEINEDEEELPYQTPDEIMKDLSADSESGKAITPSSIGNIKNKKGKVVDFNEEISEENTDKKENKLKGKTILSKADIFERIFSSLGGITISESERVYNYIIKSITMKEDKDLINGKVEESDVMKALDILENTITKGKKDDDEDENWMDDEDGDDDSKDDKKKKASDECKTMMKDKMKKAQIIGALIKGGYEKDLIKEVYTEVVKELADEIAKGEGESELTKAIETPVVEASVTATAALVNDFEKGIAELSDLIQTKNYGVGVILKGIYEGINDIKADRDVLKKENEELKKALEDITESLDERFEEISKALDQPVGRKAAVRVSDRKFEKGGFEQDLSKGQTTPGNTVSINERKRILTILDNAAFEKGMDAEFCQAMTGFEATGSLSTNVINRLRDEKKIVIVK